LHANAPHNVPAGSLLKNRVLLQGTTSKIPRNILSISFFRDVNGGVLPF